MYFIREIKMNQKELEKIKEKALEEHIPIIKMFSF